MILFWNNIIYSVSRDSDNEKSDNDWIINVVFRIAQRIFSLVNWQDSNKINSFYYINSRTFQYALTFYLKCKIHILLKYNFN